MSIEEQKWSKKKTVVFYLLFPFLLLYVGIALFTFWLYDREFKPLMWIDKILWRLRGAKC